MNVPLTKPELQRFVEEQVRSGGFASPAEVVEAGLARLMLDPAPEELDDETIASIERAEAEFARGESRPFAEVAAELQAASIATRIGLKQGEVKPTVNIIRF